MVDAAKEIYEEKLPRFKKALDAGVRIAFGTDAGAPFTPLEDMVTETRIMVELGMKPIDVIASCTSVAAKTIGLGDKVGSIEKGKFADIVLLNGNPLTNIEKLGDVYCVIQNGRVVHTATGGHNE
jgi:imidazolonepropionase-like amidohydrolase